MNGDFEHSAIARQERIQELATAAWSYSGDLDDPLPHTAKDFTAQMATWIAAGEDPEDFPAISVMAAHIGSDRAREFGSLLALEAKSATTRGST